MIYILILGLQNFCQLVQNSRVKTTSLQDQLSSVAVIETNDESRLVSVIAKHL